MTRRQCLWIASALGLAVLTTLAGCNASPEPSADAKDALRVTVHAPVARVLPFYDYYTGRTVAEKTVEMRARVSGYLGKPLFKEGDLVKEGATLFVIDRRPYKAQLDKAKADIERAMASARAADFEADRQMELLNKRAGNKSDYDKAVGQAGEARASIKAAEASFAEAQLNYDFTLVKSPIDGRAGKYNITEGNLVAADNTLLTTIVSVRPMYVEFDVDENRLLLIKQLIRDKKFKGAQDGAVVPVEMKLADQKEFTYKGIINFVDNKLDPNTGTLRVRATFENADGFLSPGLFCRVRCQLGEPTKKWLITDRAVGTAQGQKFVYVVDPQNVVQNRPVTAGATFDGLRVIEAGLNGDERVIVNGMLMVRPGVTVDPVPGEMRGDTDKTGK